MTHIIPLPKELATFYSCLMLQLGQSIFLSESYVLFTKCSFHLDFTLYANILPSIFLSLSTDFKVLAIQSLQK